MRKKTWHQANCAFCVRDALSLLIAYLASQVDLHSSSADLSNLLRELCGIDFAEVHDVVAHTLKLIHTSRSAITSDVIGVLKVVLQIPRHERKSFVAHASLWLDKQALDSYDIRKAVETLLLIPAGELALLVTRAIQRIPPL